MDPMCQPRRGFQRLPVSVVPSHYDLRLKVHLDNDSFEGETDIALTFKETVTCVTFHCGSTLIIQWATLLLETDHFDDLRIYYDRVWTLATIKIPKGVSGGQQGILKLKFSGVLNNDMNGFYISTYEHNGEQGKLASTQFEPDDARNAFPCWDEPMFKATFKVTLIVPEDKVALCNTRALETVSLGSGWKSVEFANTPVMSTYLIAFAVGDFKYIQGETKRGVPVRFYSTPGKSHLGRFALEVACKSLDFFESYFDIQYTLDKCDLVAIPDFSMGASENWGLITFRELYVMVDPNVSSTVARQNVALVVAHEVSHMWFGNLATMKWWTDLWLKEGFATWMEVKVVDRLFPEYDVWTQFALEHVREALMLDSMISSHPIEQPIVLPSDIEENYDVVSYSKGAAVVNMIEHYLGEEVVTACLSHHLRVVVQVFLWLCARGRRETDFKAGIRHYLKTYAFSNAEADDLWRVLEEVSGKEVKEMMGQWTRREGYPVIKAQLRQDNDIMLVQLDQKHFISTPGRRNEALWKVPVTMNATCFKSVRVHLLDKRLDIIELKDFENHHWLKLNVGLSGFFRVQYSIALMTALVPQISGKVLPPIDRMEICDDLFALVSEARAGQASHVEFLELLMHYKDEEDFTVLSCIISSLNILLDCAEGQAFEKPLQKFCCQFFGPLARNLGWQQANEEKHTVSMLRSMVLDILSKCRDQSVVDTADELFQQHIENGKPLLPDLRAMIFTSICRYGKTPAFEKVLNIYQKTTFSEVQRDCLRALGCSGDHDVLERLMALLDSDAIRVQDVHLAMLGMVKTLAGRKQAWRYFRARMNALADRYGGTKRPLFQRCLEICTQSLCTKEDAESVMRFFREPISADPALRRPVNQSVENINLNAATLERDGQKLCEWLRAHGY